MLGMKSDTRPITGDAAKDIRDTVRRWFSGNLNEKDKEQIKKRKDLLEKLNVTIIK